MSAVFGFWNLDGRPADPARVAAMSDVLAHRGPDGWASWCEGPVAVGHRMFRTTPESVHERQPLVADGGLRVLAADLRLDNRDDLIRRAGPRQRAVEELSDAELLCRVHEVDGGRTPEGLLGAFAYVVWDAERRELLCVRDHFGEKPLYYFHAPGRLFAFASEIKALLALGEVPDDVDELEVARHLHIPLPDDLSATYYRAVRCVKPAHALTVTPSGIHERRYWSLDRDRSLGLSGDEDYADVVRETFVEAVRCRLRATGPIASMLSGGLDSSSITSVAARLLGEGGGGRKVRALSAIYPDVPASDERSYIDAVVADCGAESSVFRADRVSPVSGIDRINRHGDGANRAGNLYLNTTLYATAAAGGARVVLDGFDGDTTLSHGEWRMVELARANRWWTLGREVRARAALFGQPWGGAMRAWVGAYGVAPVLRRVRRRARRNTGTPGPATAPAWAQGLAPDFVARIAGHVVPPPPVPRTEREHHHWMMMRPILLQSLGWIEAVGAGEGVEVRFPFFDVRLVELCLSLPADQKLRHGLSRFVMRQAMRGLLTEAVRRRPDKANAEPGFHHALRAHAAHQLGAAWQRPDDRLSRYFDVAYCAELNERFMRGVTVPHESFRSWRMTSLALWLTRSQGATTAHSSGAGEAAFPGRSAPALVGTTTRET